MASTRNSLRWITTSEVEGATCPGTLSDRSVTLGYLGDRRSITSRPGAIWEFTESHFLRTCRPPRGTYSFRWL